MDTYSSDESSKPHSTHKAYVLNELKEAKKVIALKEEALQRLEERMAKVELKQERSSHSFHGRHNSPRLSSKDSSNAHGHGEDYRRRRHRHYSNGGSHHRNQGHHQEVDEDQKVKIASLEFIDYAMKWWHSIVTDVCYNKRPLVAS